MGLFSKLFKNKQESTGVDSGFYIPADEQAATARARSKRASNAGGGTASRRSDKDVPDPVLPEKKRARRRLVGAIALALGVAVGLPMILDSEPKPLASDIAIQIPSKDKPAERQPAARTEPAKVADSAALDQSEEIVSEPARVRPVPAATPPKPAAVDSAAPAVTELKPPKAATVETPKAEPKPAPRPEVKHEPKPEVKHEPKPAAPKPAVKPAQSADDALRALAILEGKPAAKPQEAGSGKYVIQVAALATQDKVDELQDKLKEAGIKSYTQKVSGPSGDRIRVRVGPFGSKEDAEKARARLQKLGLGGSLVAA